MIQFFRNLFFRDFWLKLFSLVLAVLIWKIVSMAIGHQVSPTSPDTQENTFDNVPVRVLAIAEDLRSFKVQPTEVSVVVRGERDALQKLQLTDIHAHVDLTGIESARNLSKRIEVLTPPGITVVRTSPELVNVVVPPKP